MHPTLLVIALFATLSAASPAAPAPTVVPDIIIPCRTNSAAPTCPADQKCVIAAGDGVSGLCKPSTVLECGGIVAQSCPAGYRCIYSKPGSSLGNCVYGPHAPPPRPGQACGRDTDADCPAGQYCIGYTIVGQQPGKCSTQDPETAFCGGITGTQCPKGYTCPNTAGTCKKIR